MKEAEQFAQEKNHREFYATLNEVYDARFRSSLPVRSKDGTLLTSSEEIKRSSDGLSISVNFSISLPK